jgi:Arc/MetJ family transcription regulator
MTRITVDVNDEWLEAAQEILGTNTAAATINEALHKFALPKKATEILAALDSVEMDLTGSQRAWRYGGGRDLARLAEKAREGDPPRGSLA